MEFKKKIKQRTAMQIGWLLIILISSAIAFVVGNQAVREFVIPFASIVVVISGSKIYSNIILLRDDEKLKKREIAETDERNLSLIMRARGMTFVIGIYSACVAILILSLLDFQREMQVIAYCMCFLLVLYFAVYYILQRKY